MTDLKKSIERLAEVDHFTVSLPGTWSASDYLGDSANDAGSRISGSRTLEAAEVNCQTAPDASSDLVIENETTGTTHTITVDGTHVRETGIGLSFSGGDEISVYFSSVGGTAAGANGEVVLEFDVDLAPMN